jgi:hypothetical protein
MNDYDKLKELAKALLTAMEQKQFFVEGYANGSASISEAKEAMKTEHQAYSNLWDFLKEH